ncbi:glycosyltransferase [Bacillus sp. FJAT-29790]|uniref:glycosyltransferase n=1 Tax=Bacillus sp. FJAT-29790 TaxID=1895002 RepID=UPI001C24D7DA|nr:glycosyltransferase [Bacillus sp. FJAT-29790]MBU8881155.1 glycosyltransferase [Bacillus sp. FJAT-29790]
MSTKKVLVITNMYPTEKHKSFGIFVKNQVEALKRRGLSVDVAAIQNPDSGKLNVLKKYSSWFFKTILALMTKGKSYDVVHAHYVFPSGLLAYFFKKLFGTRLIVTAHGGDIDKMARKNKQIYSLTKKILQEADQVIAVGQELYDTIVDEFSVPVNRISIINMGVNRDVFKPISKIEARKTCDIKTEEIPILYVGNLIKQKGLLELVEAIRLLKKSEPNVRLFLIGPDKDQSFKKELFERIQQLNINNEVSYLGVKSQKEISEWMSASEVFVLPSHIEGFGLVALEAMACGTPVVGTNVGGLKYLLADGAGKIVPVKDAEALSEGILHILTSKENKDMLVKNGEEKAEENDQEQMLNRVIEVYFPTGG